MKHGTQPPIFDKLTVRNMKPSYFLLILMSAVVALAVYGQQGQPKYRTSPTGYSDTPYLPDGKWRVHDIARPKPPVVTPGSFSTDDKSGVPPSDAIVLFNGKDLSKWTGGLEKDGKARPAGWKVENGYVECTHATGDLVSKEKFGDMQLHLEFASPTEIDGDSQWRGNSGVLLMSAYEIQVLDSYNNPTYADGQAGAIYGQYPPLVNPTRPPGSWQQYDIFFEAPKFSAGKLLKPAYVTVMLNGIMLHHHQQIVGRMAHKVVGLYQPHGDEEPLALQNHDTKVRYRNIWVRRLKGYDQQ